MLIARKRQASHSAKRLRTAVCFVFFGVVFFGLDLLLLLGDRLLLLRWRWRWRCPGILRLGCLVQPSRRGGGEQVGELGVASVMRLRRQREQAGGLLSHQFRGSGHSRTTRTRRVFNLG